MQRLEGLPRQQHRAQPLDFVLDVGADDGDVGDAAPSDFSPPRPLPGIQSIYRADGVDGPQEMEKN